MLNFKSTAEPAFDYSNLEAHELANLLPMIDDVNFANLRADIEKNILEPILLFEGKILDGRNRYRAAKEVGRLAIPPAQHLMASLFVRAKMRCYREGC